MSNASIYIDLLQLDMEKCLFSNIDIPNLKIMRNSILSASNRSRSYRYLACQMLMLSVFRCQGNKKNNRRYHQHGKRDWRVK